MLLHLVKGRFYLKSEICSKGTMNSKEVVSKYASSAHLLCPEKSSLAALPPGAALPVVQEHHKPQLCVGSPLQNIKTHPQMCPGTHKSLLFWDTSLQGLEVGVLQAEAVPAAVAVHGPETPQEPGRERIPRERLRKPACTTQHRQEKRHKMLPEQTHPIFRSAQQKAKLKAPQGSRAAYQKNLPLWHNHGHKREREQTPVLKEKGFVLPSTSFLMNLYKCATPELPAHSSCILSAAGGTG